MAATEERIGKRSGRPKRGTGIDLSPFRAGYEAGAITATDIADRVAGSLPSITRRIKRLGWRTPSKPETPGPAPPVTGAVEAPALSPAPAVSSPPAAPSLPVEVDARALAISASLRVLAAADASLQAAGASIGPTSLRSLAAAISRASDALQALGVIEPTPSSLPELVVRVMTADEEVTAQAEAEGGDPGEVDIDEPAENRTAEPPGNGLVPEDSDIPGEVGNSHAPDAKGLQKAPIVALRQMAAAAGIQPVPRSRAALIAAIDQRTG